jgi:hypothetical protein
LGGKRRRNLKESEKESQMYQKELSKRFDCDIRMEAEG